MELFHARPVVGEVELLDLLDDMISLGSKEPLITGERAKEKNEPERSFSHGGKGKKKTDPFQARSRAKQPTGMSKRLK